MWSKIAKHIIISSQAISTPDSDALTLGFSEQRMEHELKSFCKFLNSFPKDRTYNIDEILYSLDKIQFQVIKSSRIILLEVLEILMNNELLNGQFIRDIGIYTTKREEIITMSLDEIDHLACKGLMAIDKSSIVMQFIYKNGKCPFCSQPALTNDFITVLLTEEIKGGITFILLKKDEVISFHRIT